MLSHTKTNFYRVLYFDINRTKYFMLQEFDINFDLTAVFILRKFYPVVQTLAQLNTFEYI